MPRRKQGHSKESAPGGYLKKSDPDSELVQNESFKNFPTKNDLLIKFKKNASFDMSSSSCNEKIERKYLEPPKSLNDIMVSHQEINNNFVQLPEPDDNENYNEVEKCNLIVKDDKKDSCLNNVILKSNFLNASYPLPVTSSQNEKNCEIVSMIQKHSAATTGLVHNVLSLDNVLCSNTLVANKHFPGRQETYSNCSNMNGDIEGDKQTTEMSGVSPAITAHYGIGNQVDSQERNYRISTSVNENKTSQSKETISTTVESQSCQLPSSVYGTPASAVEKMLTSHIPPEKDSKYKEGKTSFLQEILEQKSTKSKICDSELCSEKKSDNKIYEQTDLSISPLKSSIHSVPVSDKERCSTKLKLSIPEGMTTDDSCSSVFSTESSKSSKIPRITSPQILEQHINKIISNNIAIIDTVDAVWSRRYANKTVSSNNASSDGDPRKLPQKVYPSDEKTSVTNLPESNTKSKLQSALLGGSVEVLGNSQKNIPPSKLNIPKDGTNSQFNNISTTVSSISVHSKMSSSVSEEELKGSAIKSLLSLKQGQFSKEKTAFTFDKDIFAVHPQNPEGSIIKDLLLKSKSQEDLRLYNEDNFNDSAYRMKNLSYKQMVASNKCSYCNLEFPDKYSFDAHTSSCFGFAGNNLLHLRDPIESFRLKEINAQSKSLPLDYHNRERTQIQQEKSNFESVTENIDNGPILKKQLLMPLSKSPPIKRRKVSDSVILPSYLTNQNASCDLKNIPTKFPTNKDLLPPRSRSQSVHLFGGEVHVLDGYRTKKFKIQNSLHGAFSVFAPKLSDYSFDKSNTSKDTEKGINHLPPAAVVTIAQPVHNSGGTVHLPTRRSTSSFSSIYTLPNSINEEVSRETDFVSITHNSNISRSLNLPSNMDVYPSGFSNTFFYPQKTSEQDSSMKGSEALPGPVIDEISPISMKVTISPTNRPFYSPIFSSSEGKLDATSKMKEAEVSSNHILPTVMFTPSSPTLPPDSEVLSSSSSISVSNKKFLSPTRPTSLPLKKKQITMVSFGTGTTLISPETPRPKKNCLQLYLNGHAYTYLGLKCSTRSTYCCIYRPQPMFVLQETNPKLSMYSNWQVVPAKEELSGLTPGQMISLYCSKQKKELKSITSMSKLGEPLIFTHSSYWTFRSQDKAEQSTLIVSNNSQDANVSSETNQDFVSTENIRSESVITSIISKPEKQVLSADDSSAPLDTENTISDGDANNSNDDEDDDDDCQDDGTGSLTDSSQPQPPKRVKIFEGGFKSNEDYTYVRGRGRGKYVCEECGIRCKKPSMLKKHIRTHTDLRPYKCRHCSFAFKTKGNLTKHMKSKAHHKKCTELGIIPVPTTTDDSQIDAEALAKQEQIEKKKAQFSDGEDADDDDDDETEESEEECESDASSMIASNQKPRMLTNGHSKKCDSQERGTDSFDDSTRGQESISQQAEEHEVARSLLNLSAFGEPSQWSTSTGDLTDVTSAGESEVGSLTLGHDQSLLSPSTFSTHTISSSVISSTRSKNISDQWLSSETLGHRPRSYSADIPLSGGKQVKYKLVKDIIAETGTKLHVDESSEFGVKEQYARRYSISVAREARKPRVMDPHEWGSLNTSLLSSHKLRNPEAADQPMDLSVTRDLSKGKPAYSAEIAGSLMNIVTQDSLPDMNLASGFDSCLSESYQIKPLPVLSPQVLVEYETGENSSTDPSLLPLMDDQSSVGASTSRSLFYIQDISSLDNTSKRKDGDVSEEPSSPDMVDYAAACSPVSPPSLDDSAYYYSQEGVVQTAANSEELPSSSRHQAEFIVPSTSSGNMEEGKCVCRICNKMFAKSSHLRLHVNIHYFERPFRCDNCAVSFRTKGHLQKHKRSVSHYNKVNMNLTFGTPTVDNPRPFKCADCKIAFRIHGHLAKHLRSKMHIMKLECLGKLPFGMYAEMERSGVSLNEIDTTDCNNSLESLQVMAQKLYQRDPRRMRWQGTEQTSDTGCVIPNLSTNNSQSFIDSMLPMGETSAASFDSTGRTIGLSATVLTNSKPEGEEVKQEASQTNVMHNVVSTFVDTDSAISSLPRYISPQSVTTSVQDTSPRIEVTELESAMSLNRSGTCHICGRHFKSAKFLQVHLYCDHPNLTPSSVNESPTINASTSSAPESREFGCDLCGKQFPNDKILQQHLLSHAQPRPFLCEICDAGFTSSSSLVAHQATHQNNSSTPASDNRIVQLK